MKACVWLAVHDTYQPPKGQLMLHSSKVLIGLGAMQVDAVTQATTIGELRNEWGMSDDLCGELADDRKAWVYTDDDYHGDGTNSLTMVLVEV